MLSREGETDLSEASVDAVTRIMIKTQRAGIGPRGTLAGLLANGNDEGGLVYTWVESNPLSVLEMEQTLSIEGLLDSLLNGDGKDYFCGGYHFCELHRSLDRNKLASL